MNDARHKQQLLASKQDRLKAFIAAHPDQLDELFRFTDAAVRELALTQCKQLELRDASLLCDRIDYLSKTRIVHQRQEAPRCRGKVIYTEREAHAKANRIWQTGRGHMRVYSCPVCKGHHLTHQAYRDSDRQVA